MLLAIIIMMSPIMIIVGSIVQLYVRNKPVIFVNPLPALRRIYNIIEQKFSNRFGHNGFIKIFIYFSFIVYITGSFIRFLAVSLLWGTVLLLIALGLVTICYTMYISAMAHFKF